MEGTEAQSTGPELLIGSHIGQYRVQRKLGEGGMGVVYEAVHQMPGKRAAVKVLHGKLSSVSTVGHPGLVQIIAQLATTLSVTHDHGIVHPDLKPDNVLLVPDPLAPSGERAKILDFGIAEARVPAPATKSEHDEAFR